MPVHCNSNDCVRAVLLHPCDGVVSGAYSLRSIIKLVQRA
jgi:hypothetical protein